MSAVVVVGTGVAQVNKYVQENIPIKSRLPIRIYSPSGYDGLRGLRDAVIILLKLQPADLQEYQYTLRGNTVITVWY